MSSVLLALATFPGSALAEHEGEEPGDGMTLVEGVTTFVLYPGLILVVVGLLAWLPSVMQATRYRPARGWDAPPLWFAGPPDPDEALVHAPAGLDGRGGARGEW